MNNQFRDRKGERGSILATAALSMTSLLLGVGLCVDISRFYLTKTELQNAVDAASLAGASALNSTPGGVTEATNRAVRAMNSHQFNKVMLNIPREKVQFAVNLNGPYMSESSATTAAKDIRFVRVTTPDVSVAVTFASLVLGSQKTMKATATAGLSIPINSYCNFIPLSVIDYDVPMTPGNVYTIRASTGESPSPGNYQILAVAGPGGNEVEYGIGGGVDACAEPGAVYSVDTKPGLTSGKVRKGINTRFDDYQGTNLSPSEYPPDTNVKESITYKQYTDGSPMQEPRNPGVYGRRIVLIPIVKLAEYDQGRNTVKFNRFGAFFLKTKVGGGNGGTLEAEYIEDRIVVGKGRYNPNGPVGDPLLAAPVLYK